MVYYFEPSLQKQETESYLPAEYKNTLLDYIVGFEIEITELTGTFKLGQNRSLEDQAALLEGLSKQNDADSKQLAEFIKSDQNL